MKAEWWFPGTWGRRTRLEFPSWRRGNESDWKPWGCGSIPGLTQWVKDPALPVSCGVDRRHGSDLALLWLWRRPATVALIGPLAWEPLHAVGAALKTKGQKDKKKVSQDKVMRVNGGDGCIVMWMHLIPLYYTLRKVKMESAVCVNNTLTHTHILTHKSRVMIQKNFFWLRKTK